MADNVSAVVMDHPTVELMAQKLGTPIYGLVGFPFFARFKMTLDYQTKTMTLSPSAYKPPDVMKGMMQAIFSGGAVKTLAPAAQWGVQVAKESGDENDGVDVTGVVSGSAAEKAGLKRGDRLLTLDGRWTDSLADLFEAASKVKPGTTVTVKVKRAGKEIELKVTPVKGM
jgi:S1-C subfamily serine protease